MSLSIALLAGTLMTSSPVLTEVARHDRAYSPPTWSPQALHYSADGATLDASPWRLDRKTGKWTQHEPSAPPRLEAPVGKRTGFHTYAAARLSTSQWVISRQYRPPRRHATQQAPPKGRTGQLLVVDSSAKVLRELWAGTAIAPREVAVSKGAIAARHNGVTVWSRTGTQAPRTFAAQAVRGLAFDARGALLGAGALNDVLVWTLKDGAMKTMKGHTGDVSTVAFHPSRPVLVSGGWDNALRVWSLETGKQVQVITFSARVDAVAFSADGTRLAVATAEGTGTLIEYTVQ